MKTCNFQFENIHKCKSTFATNNTLPARIIQTEYALVYDTIVCLATDVQISSKKPDKTLPDNNEITKAQKKKVQALG